VGDQMKNLKKFIMTVFIIGSVFLSLAYVVWRVEIKNVAESNLIIAKIEEFKSREGSFPSSLEVVGLKQTEHGGDPFYEIHPDSKSYCVSFESSTNLFDQISYCSNTKKWDHFCGSWLFGNKHCHYP
jgi:hypothetical protein